MAAGSLGLAVAAMGVAYPLDLGLCGFAHGLGPGFLGRAMMGLIHFMTSIPTMIYGFVSVIFPVPLVRGVFPESAGYSWLTAALTLSLMILPTIVLLVHARLQQVDARVRLVSAALGFSPAQTLPWVMRPLATRGFGLGAGFQPGLGGYQGAAMAALLAAEIVTPGIVDALDLLLHPDRLRATLRL